MPQPKSEDADGEPGRAAVGYRRAGAENGEPGQRADDHRVSENLKDAEEALSYRLLFAGRGMGDGGGAEAGLV